MLGGSSRIPPGLPSSAHGTKKLLLNVQVSEIFA
jgi:hypothetical protein